MFAAPNVCTGLLMLSTHTLLFQLKVTYSFAKAPLVFTCRATCGLDNGLS